ELPAASLTRLWLALRFRPIVPSPVDPLMTTLTCQAYGLPPTSEGACTMPVTVPVTGGLRKLDANSGLTGSEKVTYHESTFDFVGVAPTRMIDVTVGAI